MPVKGQAQFGFAEDIDRQVAEDQEKERQRRRRGNDIAILRSIVRQHPLNDYERKVLPRGVRPKRFVIDWECRVCPYNRCDHSIGNRFGTYSTKYSSAVLVCVCIKDMINKGHMTEGELQDNCKERG